MTRRHTVTLTITYEGITLEDLGRPNDWLADRLREYVNAGGFYTLRDAILLMATDRDSTVYEIDKWHDPIRSVLAIDGYEVTESDYDCEGFEDLQNAVTELDDLADDDDGAGL
jgi:hypothetical protein